MTNEQMNAIRAEFKAAYTAFGPYGVITEAKSPSNPGMSLYYIQRCWELAMNAYFSPFNLSESALNADGTPKHETLKQFPKVLNSMAEARLQLENLLNNPWR